MIPWEIVSAYRMAESKPVQISILAQLNDCYPSDIVELLVHSGVPAEDIPKRYRKVHHTRGRDYSERPAYKKGPNGKMVCIDCGTLFEGRPPALRCPACKSYIIAERKKQYRKRQKAALKAAREAVAV